MFKRHPGVWRCSAPVVVCRSGFSSCNRHGTSCCLEMSSTSCLLLPLLPEESGKSLPLAMLRYTLAASPGGITVPPAHWVHSPHLGLSLMQRAALSAAFLSIIFGKFILLLINSHALVGHKRSSCPLLLPVPQFLFQHGCCEVSCAAVSSLWWVCACDHRL